MDLGENRNLCQGLGWILPKGIFPAVASSLLEQFHLDPISCLSFSCHILIHGLLNTGTGESHSLEQDNLVPCLPQEAGCSSCSLEFFVMDECFVLDLQDAVIPKPVSGCNPKKT